MNKAGKKRPLKECLGENSNTNELRHKRRRFDNIVLLREAQSGQNNEGVTERRYYEDGEIINVSPRRILRAGGKRKKPTEVDDGPVVTASNKQAEKNPDENDIINELTKEFKKARLRPVFFTISSFIEQTVDEVGFTMADEPETEVTIRLALPKKEKSEVEGTISISVAMCDTNEKVGNDMILMKTELAPGEAGTKLIDASIEQKTSMKTNDTGTKGPSPSNISSMLDLDENVGKAI